MSDSHSSDIVLTGIPRSGTTLSCHLLNKLPDVVALHEPIVWDLAAAAKPDRAGVCRQIDAFFQDTRRSLRQSQSVFSKQLDGAVPDNPMSEPPLLGRFVPNRLLEVPALRRLGLRTERVSRKEISIAKSLGPDFNLVIKHTGPFTALLRPLSKTYRCYAIVRNPLSVLLSWNGINVALRDGRMHEAERLDARLAFRLAEETERFERQIALLDWFFVQYERELSGEHIVRYEDIIVTRGRALQVAVRGASTLDEPLVSKNDNTLYDQDLWPILKEKLLGTDGAFWRFYSKDCVETLFLT